MARVQPGGTAVVVGDGAVGLMGVLAAKQMGADKIIAMSRHKSRQDLALEFGATHIVSERGEDGVARIKDLTGGRSLATNIALVKHNALVGARLAVALHAAAHV